MAIIRQLCAYSVPGISGILDEVPSLSIDCATDSVMFGALHAWFSIFKLDGVSDEQNAGSLKKLAHSSRRQ
jgi:hypothetical protein